MKIIKYILFFLFVGTLGMFLLGPETLNNALYKLTNIEKRALHGDKKAIGKAFMHFTTVSHDYKAGEQFFRNLEKKNFGKGYLGLLLLMTPSKTKEIEIEGLACLHESIDEGDIKLTETLDKFLSMSEFNITRIDLETSKCN